MREAGDGLKTEGITAEQLEALKDLRAALALDDNTFIRIVEAAGADTLLAKSRLWARLRAGLDELDARDKYVAALNRLGVLAEEQKGLESVVEGYRDTLRNL
jgi:hypothetical protein